MAAATSEGFALLRLDTPGRAGLLCLYLNPALQRMICGRDQLALDRFCEAAQLDLTRECLRAAQGSAPHLIDARDPSGDFWLSLRIEAVGPREFILLVRDRTDEGRAELRHAEAFAELHHRLKNSLAGIAGLLELQASAEAAPNVTAALKLAADRVYAIADLHSQLYRCNRGEIVDLGLYVRRCCQRLARSLLPDGGVRMVVATDPASAPFEQAASLGMILNELVTNAAKHACPPPAIGSIRVELRAEPDVLVLRVADTGPGFDGSKKAAKGLGMRLIRSLARELRAELRMEPAPTGTTFELRVPKTSAAAHS